MQTSKYGRSAFTKSPIMTCSFRCSGLDHERGVTSVALLSFGEWKLKDSLSLNAFDQFCRHPWIHFNGRTLFGLLKDTDCQISRTRTHFQNFVSRFYVRLSRVRMGNHRG